MYEYRCKIVRVVDGDTVDIDIDLGFGVWLKNERIRIYGIDTPECRTRDIVEKKFGLLAKKFVEAALPKNSNQLFVSKDFQTGKFGRILGDFKVYDAVSDAWTPLGEIMIRDSYAAPYFGQSKEEIRAIHLQNRKELISEGKIK